MIVYTRYGNDDTIHTSKDNNNSTDKNFDINKG